MVPDTIVVLGGEIIGKPSGRQEALDILTRLSGRAHQVITGVCLRSGGQIDVLNKPSRNDTGEIPVPFCFGLLQQ